MTAPTASTNRKDMATLLATNLSIHGRELTYLAASQTGQIVLIYDEHESLLYYSQVTGVGNKSPKALVGKVEGSVQTYLRTNNCLYEIEH